MQLPQMPFMQHTQRQLEQNWFDMFTKLIAVQPSVAEYEWTMYKIKVD